MQNLNQALIREAIQHAANSPNPDRVDEAFDAVMREFLRAHNDARNNEAHFAEALDLFRVEVAHTPTGEPMVGITLNDYAPVALDIRTATRLMDKLARALLHITLEAIAAQKERDASGQTPS